MGKKTMDKLPLLRHLWDGLTELCPWLMLICFTFPNGMKAPEVSDFKEEYIPKR